MPRTVRYKPSKPGHKVCTKCITEKPVLTEFYRNSKTKDGYESWCRACRIAQNMAYQKAHPKQFNEYKRRWAAKTNYYHEWYVKHREKKRLWMRAWRAANPDKVRAYAKRQTEKRNQQKMERMLAWLVERF